MGEGNNITEAPAQIICAALSPGRIPLATYRLQFNLKFTFADARKLVPYLFDLGITDVYSSSILKARPGSMHGYDICDHGRLNPELGSDQDFDDLVQALKEHSMGLIVDTVPNHMGIFHSSNTWWTDVLENGPSSLYAAHFDIDWQPVNPNLINKVLLPLLEDQYGTVLEAGKIRLAFEDGTFCLYYYETRLPVEPRSYSVILERPLPELKAALGDDHEHVQEFHSILTALSYLPAFTELDPEKIVERNREKEVIKRRIASLATACPTFQEAISRTVNDFNGAVGNPPSFDLLDRLLEAQPYRMAFWRVAAEEINYRRFFDINELAAIRMELPEVFQAAHQLLLKFLAEGKINGLRIDHPDGLRDPAKYFRDLQEAFLLERARVNLAPEHVPADLDQQVKAQLEAHLAGSPQPRPPWPLYVVAEKILGDNEPLPADWAVSGTTGYDFLNAVNGLFVNSANREAFDSIYEHFFTRRWEFNQLVMNNKKMIMLVSMAGELAALGHQLDRISEGNRRYRDFTLNGLTFAIREIIAALSIYRTYINGKDAPSLRDRLFIEEAVALAKDLNPRTAGAIFDFIRDTLLLRNLQDFRADDQPHMIAWTLMFQQVTGPVLAKGLEDTTFYVYNRLASLNEVGGHPENFGVAPGDFHHQNEERQRKWPHSMLATASHDTKRSEDLRARLNVLSEVPEEWQAALARWGPLNAPKKTIVEGNPAPDGNEEYLLYQTLLGVWPPVGLTAQTMPAFRLRIANYMQKAIKEAKVHTSWVNPNQEYDAAVEAFVQRLLPDQLDDPFLTDLVAFQERLAFFGYFNALSQVLLKATSPGVPDFYQGTELWDFSLVDPDNRRPVDYQLRHEMMAALKNRLDQPGTSLVPLVQDLLANMSDGRIKLYVIERALNVRKAEEALFRDGSYQRLEAAGDKSHHLCAYSRALEDKEFLVAVPRLLVGLTGERQRPPLGPEIWGETQLPLPDRQGIRYRNVFTGECLQVGDGLSLATIFQHFPIALFQRC